MMVSEGIPTNSGDNVVSHDQFREAKDKKEIEQMRKRLREKFSSEDYTEEVEEPEED